MTVLNFNRNTYTIVFSIILREKCEGVAKNVVTSPKSSRAPYRSISTSAQSIQQCFCKLLSAENIQIEILNLINACDYDVSCGVFVFGGGGGERKLNTEKLTWCYKRPMEFWNIINLLYGIWDYPRTRRRGRKRRCCCACRTSGVETLFYELGRFKRLSF